MELRAKATYRAPDFDMFEGHTTLELPHEISDERKKRMLADFPDSFEVLSASEEKAIRDRLTADAASAKELAANNERIGAEIVAAREAAKADEAKALEIETKEDLLRLQGRAPAVESKEEKPKTKRK